jgi:hypothetical protein
MPSRHERIERKANALKRLDPEREVELEDAFTNHLADTVRARSLRECRQEIDKAIEVYEDALNRALYETLEKHLADGDSSFA